MGKKRTKAEAKKAKKVKKAKGGEKGEKPKPDGLLALIAGRRSVKRFDAAEVTREEIEQLLNVAVHAPNHRMTEPWRFYVLGPAARRAYGDALGIRKARRIEDPEAATLVRTKVAEEHEALPAAIAVAMKVAEDPEVQREDFAATFMAVQNLTLAASALGLGTHIKTGAVMEDPAARAAVGVGPDERIVAFLYLGRPRDIPEAKARTDARILTTWRD